MKFYWVFLGFTGFYWVLLGFTGFYWFLLGFTGFYWVLPGFTGISWVLPSFRVASVVFMDRRMVESIRRPWSFDIFDSDNEGRYFLLPLSLSLSVSFRPHHPLPSLLLLLLLVSEHLVVLPLFISRVSGVGLVQRVPPPSLSPFFSTFFLHLPHVPLSPHHSDRLAFDKYNPAPSLPVHYRVSFFCLPGFFFWPLRLVGTGFSNVEDGGYRTTHPPTQHPPTHPKGKKGKRRRPRSLWTNKNGWLVGGAWAVGGAWGWWVAAIAAV